MAKRKGPTPRRRPVAAPAPAADPGGVRRTVERRSAAPLAWLSLQPRFLVPLVTVGLLVAGLALPAAYGVPLLVLLGLLVGWLAYLSWPAVQGAGRAVRLLLVALVAAAVVSRVAG